MKNEEKAHIMKIHLDEFNPIWGNFFCASRGYLKYFKTM